MSLISLIPSVGCWCIDGDIYLDRKFYDGVCEYSRSWTGLIKVIIRMSDDKVPDFGIIKYDKNIFPADLVVIDKFHSIGVQDIYGSDIVFSSADNNLNLNLSFICFKSKILCVYSIENIIETRLQIVYLSTESVWKKIKSTLWHIIVERKRRMAIKLANGIQANGLAAYEEYKGLSSNIMYYFDTRIEEDMLVTDDDLSRRFQYLDNDTPIRLGFSGRLIAMKGADHLIELANKLQHKNVRFSMDIFGDGGLKNEMQEMVRLYRLEDNVIMHGTVDFKSELIPFMKQHVDYL